MVRRHRRKGPLALLGRERLDAVDRQRIHGRPRRTGCSRRGSPEPGVARQGATSTRRRARPCGSTSRLGISDGQPTTPDPDSEPVVWLFTAIVGAAIAGFGAGLYTQAPPYVSVEDISSETILGFLLIVAGLVVLGIALLVFCGHGRHPASQRPPSPAVTGPGSRSSNALGRPPQRGRGEGLPISTKPLPDMPRIGRPILPMSSAGSLQRSRSARAGSAPASTAACRSSPPRSTGAPPAIADTATGRGRRLGGRRRRRGGAPLPCGWSPRRGTLVRPPWPGRLCP